MNHVKTADSTSLVSKNVKIEGLPKLQVGTTPPLPAMLGDFVWEDLNANGIDDDTDGDGNPDDELLVP